MRHQRLGGVRRCERTIRSTTASRRRRSEARAYSPAPECPALAVPRRGPPHGADTSGTGPFSCSPCFPSPDGQQSKLWPAYAVMTDQYNRLQETTHRQRGKILQENRYSTRHDRNNQVKRGRYEISSRSRRQPHPTPRGPRPSTRPHGRHDYSSRHPNQHSRGLFSVIPRRVRHLAAKPRGRPRRVSSARNGADSHCDRSGPRSQPGALD